MPDGHSPAEQLLGAFAHATETQDCGCVARAMVDSTPA
jgi:hypothetical protein